MKKVLRSLAATSMILGLAVSAQAANNAGVTLTSPAIIKDGCEKIGTITFSLDGGTVLTEGDWWYMDLPSGSTFCSTVDYFIGNVAAPGAATDTITFPSTASALGGATGAGITDDDTDVVFGGTATAIGVIAAGGSYADAIDATKHIVENTIVNVTGGATVAGAGGIVLRVTATSGSQRAWVRVYGDGAQVLGTNGTYTINGDAALNITIADGQAYEDHIFLNNTTTATAADNIWGNDATDQINLTAAATRGTASVPHIANSFCANAESMSGSLMFVSFDSLNAFLTFSGDSQLAHVASANTVALAYCAKGETSGNILLGAQNACSFDYELGTGGNYCTAFGGNIINGGRMFIGGTSTFGNPGDLYDMTITSNTAGVYFTAGATVTGFAPAATDECIATPTSGIGVLAPGAFTLTNEAGTPGATAPGATCTVDAANRVRNISTGAGGAMTGIDTFDSLWVNLPTMVYDTAEVGNGVESDITITVTKYPCGTLISESATIGTFVTTCPAAAAAGTTNLLYPFLPPMDGSTPGWWGGFTVNNGGTGSGTCALTFTEEDGDVGTYTTPSIAAGGQWNAGAMATLLGMLTADAGNTGTLGDSNVAVAGTCAFGTGAGFAFTGNGDEGTGYTAYSTAW